MKDLSNVDNRTIAIYLSCWNLWPWVKLQQ